MLNKTIYPSLSLPTQDVSLCHLPRLLPDSILVLLVILEIYNLHNFLCLTLLIVRHSLHGEYLQIYRATYETPYLVCVPYKHLSLIQYENFTHLFWKFYKYTHIW